MNGLKPTFGKAQIMNKFRNKIGAQVQDYNSINSKQYRFTNDYYNCRVSKEYADEFQNYEWKISMDNNEFNPDKHDLFFKMNGKRFKQHLIESILNNIDED